ncbi:hypothetical protein [Acholeplasma laidlawii]|uniref:hypothetical protein n=1 Tax=Acholeplasma laidlawii TaxID=2148 RepID=UPI0021F76F14|nr:hypothetical protein [Acholeplasma laidlawii]
MKRKVYTITIITTILLLVISFIVLSNRTTEGIPRGTYFRLDESGSMIKDGFESGWSIKNKEAEHRYLTYRIKNIDGVIYFEIELLEEDGYSSQVSGLYRYEVQYDDKTKILVVTMHADSVGNPSVVPNSEFDLKEFQFKKSGFSIG